MNTIYLVQRISSPRESKWIGNVIPCIRFRNEVPVDTKGFGKTFVIWLSSTTASSLVSGFTNVSFLLFLKKF